MVEHEREEGDEKREWEISGMVVVTGVEEKGLGEFTKMPLPLFLIQAIQY